MASGLLGTSVLCSAGDVSWWEVVVGAVVGESVDALAVELCIGFRNADSMGCAVVVGSPVGVTTGSVSGGCCGSARRILSGSSCNGSAETGLAKE
ncbi:hypothetical protein MTO96_042267 [Rhipicephalus appendiculatus]